MKCHQFLLRFSSELVVCSSGGDSDVSSTFSLDNCIFPIEGKVAVS